MRGRHERSAWEGGAAEDNGTSIMESKSRALRSELKRQIERDSRFTPWLLIVVTIVFPVLEAVLVNVWTAAELRGPAGLCLAVVGVLDLLIGGLLIWNEFQSKSPLRVLADAAELADSNCSTQRELDRRVQFYRMFRDAVETMNNQVCSIQRRYDQKLWMTTRQ